MHCSSIVWFSLDVFIPTHDSLLVNLKESKEVWILSFPSLYFKSSYLCVCVCVRSGLCLGFHFPVSYLSTAQALKCDTVFAAALSVCLCMCSQLVKDLLNALPGMFTHTRETQSALGPALQAAYKLMCPTGGRVSVFQTQLPTLGAGLLQSREDPNLRSSTKVTLLNHHSSSTNTDPT